MKKRLFFFLTVFVAVSCNYRIDNEEAPLVVLLNNEVFVNGESLAQNGTVNGGDTLVIPLSYVDRQTVESVEFFITRTPDDTSTVKFSSPHDQAVFLAQEVPVQASFGQFSPQLVLPANSLPGFYSLRIVARNGKQQASNALFSFAIANDSFPTLGFAQALQNYPSQRLSWKSKDTLVLAYDLSSLDSVQLLAYELVDDNSEVTLSKEAPNPSRRASFRDTILVSEDWEISDYELRFSIQTLRERTTLYNGRLSVFVQE